MTDQLQAVIEAAWDKRESIGTDTRGATMIGATTTARLAVGAGVDPAPAIHSRSPS